MASQNQPNCEAIKQNIRQFVHNTKEAIQEIKDGNTDVDEEKIQQLADTIYQLEQASDQMTQIADNDLDIELQLIQNVIHQPIYPSKRSKDRRTSISHAAKYCKENKNAEELRDFLNACAKDPESTKILLSDLNEVYETLEEFSDTE